VAKKKLFPPAKAAMFPGELRYSYKGYTVIIQPVGNRDQWLATARKISLGQPSFFANIAHGEGARGKVEAKIKSRVDDVSCICD
jgi:hypothetical protein